jgi:hypothetical protein
LYLGMFVGRVVVDDGVDRHSHRHLRLGGVEEAETRRFVVKQFQL